MIAPPPLPSTPILTPVFVSHAGVPVEVVRREHITHENALKALAKLHLLGGGVGVFATVITGSGFILALVSSGRMPSIEPSELLISAMVALLAMAQIQIGLSLHQLKSEARRGAIILATLGLLAFPVGTLVNAVILSYLLSKKGTFVLSDDYRTIVAQTPYVKAKTSVGAVILMVIFLAILAVFASLFFL